MPAGPSCCTACATRTRHRPADQAVDVVQAVLQDREADAHRQAEDPRGQANGVQHPRLEREPPASPMTLAALPAMSHLSWARRSPVARQLSTWRATNKTQNTGTARKP